MPFIAVLFVLMLFLERFVPVPLSLTLVMVAAWTVPAPLLFGVSFLTGIVADLIRLRTFGVTSALLLTLALAVFLVRKEVESSASIWVFVSGFIAQAIWFLAFSHPFMWTICLTQGVLVWLLWKTSSWLTKAEGVYLRQGGV